MTGAMNSSATTRTQPHPQADGGTRSTSAPAAIPHYIWTYLWQPGVWFFDHLTVINCIVLRAVDQQFLRHLTANDTGDANPTLLANGHPRTVCCGNARRAALQVALRQLALPLLPTRHADPVGNWPDEHGWLVLAAIGNSRRQAAMVASLIALGRQFKQRAQRSYGQAPADIDRADVANCCGCEAV